MVSLIHHGRGVDQPADDHRPRVAVVRLRQFDLHGGRHLLPGLQPQEVQPQEPRLGALRPDAEGEAGGRNAATRQQRESGKIANGKRGAVRTAINNKIE